MKADLTGDGIPESILIDERAAAEPKTGNEPTIQVLSGKTGETIWSLPVNTVHVGWNNVYLYRDGGKPFLMTWNPAMYQGAADQLRIGGQGTNGEGEYYDPSKELLEMQRV